MTQPANHSPTHFWKQQSPIILARQHSHYLPFPRSALKFDYRDAPFAGRFEGTHGHENFVLDKPHLGQNLPLVTFGNLKAELIKIHLHMPSEHDRDGKNQAGEIHLIHRLASPVTGSELFVVGVFFNKLQNADSCQFLLDWCGTEQASRLDPRRILPGTRRWYRYEGSLTTEPYSEIVSWLVLDEPLAVNSQELSLLKQHAHQPEREPQPLNRRFVIRNFR